MKSPGGLRAPRTPASRARAAAAGGPFSSQNPHPLRGPCPPRRTYRLRTYRRCFPGGEGVKWLVAGGHAPDDAAATALGNAMLQAGLLHHVAYEHTFKPSDLLYK